MKNLTMFPNCRDSKLHNTTTNGPSTGGVVIDFLQNLDNVRTITVFGMNWRGSPHIHVDFKHPNLVKNCCTKCSIHATPTSSYRPPSVSKKKFAC